MSESLTVVQKDSPGVVHATVHGTPHPALRNHVVNYTGWSANTEGIARRRHPPGTIMPLIVMFGREIGNVDDPQRGGAATYTDGFVAGMHDRYAVTESDGEQIGVQIDVTPITGYLLLGHDVSDLTNNTVSLADAFGEEGRDLRERLIDKQDWESRFRIVDTFIARRLAQAKPASPAVAWSWQQLQRTGGAVTVNDLADRVGWSRKHLATRFREQVGLAPKVAGRVMRFARVNKAIRDGWELGWSELAYRCGYYDQAHFNRDFREFSGYTPREFVAHSLPDGVED
jgi:AraC-like DNA-binding protein